MTNEELLQLMKRFRVAYATANRKELLATTSSDFVWHQNVAMSEEDLPTGKILTGVDALLQEIKRRRQQWTNVRYENMQERATADMLVQTFSISGEDDGKAFNANAVDLYPVKDGRIAKKDTYWKYRV
ncbi:MAG: nuclear transport factor 2 family protein [Pseudomonadales bacterium]|nr:nuclear transport factor 2 family protein [Pseudomonadales bacterium]MDG1444228.1 nuclear transport factor 2 family protein [Pseudomonadales bacterium]